jgi:hypothetical protein
MVYLGLVEWGFFAKSIYSVFCCVYIFCNIAESCFVTTRSCDGNEPRFIELLVWFLFLNFHNSISASIKVYWLHYWFTFTGPSNGFFAINRIELFLWTRKKNMKQLKISFVFNWRSGNCSTNSFWPRFLKAKRGKGNGKCVA